MDDLVEKVSRLVPPRAARVLGLLLTPVGFVLLATGLATWTTFLDRVTDDRDGLARAVLGVVALLAGLLLLDRGFGRGARPFGPWVPTMRVEQLPITHPDAAALVEQVQEEYVTRYGERDATALDERAFVPPYGSFFVGYVDGEPVAIGGWRRRTGMDVLGSTEVGEIKRMYVVPDAQRRGHARTMLAHLEATLAEAGAEVAVLETGMAQPEAIALYEGSGYTPIAKFGHYRDQPDQRCFGKRLQPDTP